jgi:hypothetical protein
MSKGGFAIRKEYTAAAAISNVNRFVILDTSAAGQVKAPTAATDRAWGIVETKAAAAGDFVSILCFGFGYVKLETTVTRGQTLQINGTTGTAKPIASTGYGCCRAEESGVQNDEIEVFFWGSIGDNPKA